MPCVSSASVTRGADRCVVDECGFGRDSRRSEPGPQGPLRHAKKQAGREVRLVLVRLTIRVLLQVELLSGPRTENSTDLGSIDRAFV